MKEILEIKDLSYYYKDGSNTRVIFDKCNYSFEQGKFYSIVGESGSGKTTLLMLLAGLDEPKEGSVLYKGEDIRDIGYDNYHKKDVQIIFQNYNLLNYLNAISSFKATTLAAKITSFFNSSNSGCFTNWAKKYTIS